MSESTELTGAQSLVRSLEHVGADVVFGIPGGAILPAYDPLFDSTKLRHILVRHEQGAGHAAEGYAQATGKVGVCMATSGPGATNLVTPIADAYMDSVPMVAITGQVARPAIGTDAFQEADICGITLPITKHNFLVQRGRGHPARDRRGVPPRLDRPPGPGARRPAQGRPAGEDDLRLAAEARPARLPAGHPPARQADPRGRPADRRVASARCSTSAAACSRPTRRPSCAQLAELTGIPVVTTLMARGAFPDSHPQHLGMPGMHGSVAAVTALQKADLLIALGTRFDDRVTGKLDDVRAARRTVIHADIDPAEIGKNRVGRRADRGRRARGAASSSCPRCRPSSTPATAPTSPRGGARSTDWREPLPARLRRARPTARSPRSTSSSGSARSPGPTRSTSRASASTRCGPRSSSSTRTRTPGSTPAAPGRWATPCRRRWAPRSACPTSWCGRSTVTAASR